MTRDEYIHLLAEKVASGEIDFLRVKDDLERQGIKGAEAKSVIRAVDEEALAITTTRSNRRRGDSHVFVGFVIAGGGLLITVILGNVDLVYFFGYGPFATGLALIIAGLRLRSGMVSTWYPVGLRRFRNRFRI